MAGVGKYLSAPSLAVNSVISRHRRIDHLNVGGGRNGAIVHDPLRINLAPGRFKDEQQSGPILIAPIRFAAMDCITVMDNSPATPDNAANLWPRVRRQLGQLHRVAFYATRMVRKI